MRFSLEKRPVSFKIWELTLHWYVQLFPPALPLLMLPLSPMRTFHVRNAPIMSMSHLCNLLHTTSSLHSSVFYQDQSKRTETRMILFYVCTKCGHNFVDPGVNQKGAELAGGGDEMDQ